jgi:Na+/H+ antiporter NhaD/arsenite permease-like protein
MILASASAAAVSAPPLWLLAPFALLLLAIALGPLVAEKWWHHHYPKVALGLGAVTAGWLLLVDRTPAPVLHALEEYGGFLALVGSLYLIAGGIHIRVKGESTPVGNVVFLLIGAVLANIIGTTGASMLLIRPWIRMNRFRITAFHIVFFIFIVSNVSGCLTPIGDPPLFLGYLKGVPFWWTLQHLWQAWIVGVFGLLAVFYVFDRLNFGRVPTDVRTEMTEHETWDFRGGHNVIFLALVLFAVISLPPGWREAVMVAAAAGSWFTTRREIHHANHFDFAPIKEVAWLFLGIFTTMIPALKYLELHAPPLQADLAYYWLTGSLSGVLDNAPTYLAFLATAFGLNGLSLENPAHMADFIAAHEGTLKAISVGAVFFGAMTYVGNGPNFMVKAISIHSGVKTPSFIGYTVRFAIPILLPFLAIVGVLFFSRWRIFP